MASDSDRIDDARFFLDAIAYALNRAEEAIRMQDDGLREAGMLSAMLAADAMITMLGKGEDEMSTLTITVDLSGAAFDLDRGQAVAGILSELAHSIAACELADGETMDVQDANGHTCGQWYVADR